MLMTCLKSLTCVTSQGSKMHVYHIRRPGMDLSQGYIGVAVDYRQRFKTHCRCSENIHFRRALDKYDDIEIVPLVKADEEYCYWLEEQLRPEPQMGWNISPGGKRPPTREGLTKDNDESVKRQSEKITGNSFATHEQLYTFVHPEHGIRVCRKIDLKKEFGVNGSNLSRVCNGIRHKVHGWRISDE